MNILAIDTSGRSGSVALRVSDQAPCEELVFSERGRHAEFLRPLATKLLEAAGIRASDLDGVAVGLGPGSFTGTRVGVTFAKVLAFGLDTKLYGISGFLAQAIETQRLSGEKQFPRVVAVMEPAHVTQVYAAAYELQPADDSGSATGFKYRELKAVDLWTPEDLLKDLPEGSLVTGSVVSSEVQAASRHPVVKTIPQVLAALPTRLKAVESPPTRVSSVILAELAADLLASGTEGSDVRSLEPMYVQASSAERALNART